MPRGKVVLRFIANNAARKASFKQRKRSLLKMAKELSTLCGIDACVLILSPYDPEGVAWPSRNDAISVLYRFSRLSKVEREADMTNLESFTMQRIKKLQKQYAKLREANLRKMMENHMYGAIAGVKKVDAAMINQGFGSSSVFAEIISETLQTIESKMALLKVGK